MARNLRVLVVEDNTNDAELILLEIQRSGEFDLDSAVATDQLTFTHLLCIKHWDIIICDYHLVGITAEDIIRILDENSSNIPLVVISGSLSEELQAQTDKPYLSKDRMGRIMPIIHRELQQVKAYEDILLSWGTAIELKDRDTKGHTLRVTALAVDLAELLKLCYPDICSVRIGAYLHDVGKIMVKDEVLLKPGKLDAEEMEEIKRHPTYAYQMLKPMKFLRKAIEIPYCHHERWDGSGYPRGLKGEEIPVLARIFAVADNYDAMTSDRPYRRALSSEFTLTFIMENAGKMFDPWVVNGFIEMMKERV